LRRGEPSAEQRNRDDQYPRNHVIPLRATATKPAMIRHVSKLSAVSS
jgi:hypothetical protein